LFTITSSLQASGAERIAGAGIVAAKSPLRKRIEHILDNSYTRHVKASANEVMSFTIIFLCTVTLTGFASIRGEDPQQAAYASERRAFPESDHPRERIGTRIAPIRSSWGTYRG
jgi:beta-lactamase regulating signal transducer with metallopeptidase domain